MIYLAAIFVYLFVLVGIGVYTSRRVKTESDFAVAGRTLSPWVMVCTMLAVWIGTGSIVGNAEETYRTGMAAMIIPAGTFFGMILLSFIASRARNIEASSVPEIIGCRYGRAARLLSVVALVTAYMVIVSYQFNAGGAVLEVIAGDKDPVLLNRNDILSPRQLVKGRMVYTPPQDWTGTVQLAVVSAQAPAQPIPYTIHVVEGNTTAADEKNSLTLLKNRHAKIHYSIDDADSDYRIAAGADVGTLSLIEPRLEASHATIMAAVFILAYTMLAGLLSLAYTDIVTGILIIGAMVAALPVLLYQAGGFSGMAEAFAAMHNKTRHMQFWGVYSPVQLVNYLLPVFLLILGDANQYQRIFAGRNARSSRQAVTTMIFVAMAIELLIITNAWIAASMTPDPQNGKYILIYAAKHYMPPVLGIVFLVTVVGIIVSTANSFLLIPAITFIKDVYQTHINPKATDRHVVFLNRVLILVFGLIAYGVSLAFSESTGFFHKALYAYTIYGAAITPSLVAAIVWKRATRQAAMASIIAGIAIPLLWGEVISPHVSGWLKELDAVLPAITVSVAALVGVSYLTQPTMTQTQSESK